MASWGVVDTDSATDVGIEYPDQTGTTAQFDDIWNFSVRVYEDWLNELQNICPAAWWLIHSARYSHGDGTAAYIAFMVERVLEIRRVLRASGSVYLHCDHEANAYLRQMMDAVFGASNFKNEIIWKRTGSHGRAKRWGPIHDVLLFYSKTSKPVWNRTYQPYDEEYIEKYFRWSDERGEFQSVSLTGPGTREGDSGKPWRGINPTAQGRHWEVPPDRILHSDFEHPDGYAEMSIQQRLDVLDKAGLIYWPPKGTVPRHKQYLSASPGVPLQDIVTDISQLAAHSLERTGYPTQKPQALARRIIEASSNPGDMVLDCFAGCAYVPVAAEIAGRRWIACDMSPRAWTVVRRQFHKQPNLRIATEGEYAEGEGVEQVLGDTRIISVRGPYELPKRTTEDAPILMRINALPELTFRQKAVESKDEIWDAFVEEWGMECWYCGTEKGSRRELQVDHVEPRKRDGSNDDCWNRALACIDCNGDKSNRLNPLQTIDLALEVGRISTSMRRNEQIERFERRMEWARERWEQIKPLKLAL